MKKIKLYVLDNGKMWLDKSMLLAGYPMATVDCQSPVSEWVDIPVSTFLLDHPDGLVLFDTACDPKGMSENWPESTKKASPYTFQEGETLPERLAQLKVRPEISATWCCLTSIQIMRAACICFKMRKSLSMRRSSHRP
jgi:hypothetical protein